VRGVKLERYLLNPGHETGGPKANWLEHALGFTRQNATDIAKQIVFDESKAVEMGVTEYGTKYADFDQHRCGGLIGMSEQWK